ncbi:hypothetical protein D3C73_1515190 [compost metagenome]
MAYPAGGTQFSAGGIFQIAADSVSFLHAAPQAEAKVVVLAGRRADSIDYIHSVSSRNGAK